MKKMIKKIVLIVMTAVFIGFVAFWQYYLKAYLTLPSTERFVDSFYEQYNRGEFAYLYDILSHQKIRNRLDKPKFQYMMADTYQKLGRVERRKRIEWKRVRTKDGTFFFLEYSVKRAKAHANEKFVLIKQKKDWFVFDYVIRVL